MPTFCRHNRFLENCPICSPKQQSRSRSTAAPRRSGAPRPAGAKRRSPRSAGNLTVRHVARAAEDGYFNQLVPGLRATADAQRLVQELAFAAARLELLSSDPPGVYAEIATAGDPEEAAWLCFLVAYLSPLEADDPWAGVNAARVPWATGELPDLEGVALGPRTSYEPARGAGTIAAFRAWAARAGSQAAALAGDSGWTPQRRFDRAFERLSLPGLRRAARYEFLVLAGALGVAEIEASSLWLSAENDATALAAKRVFGIGDAINLQRRAAELAAETGVPIAALDLALVNWARPDGERLTAGVAAAAAAPIVATPIAGVLSI